MTLKEKAQLFGKVAMSLAKEGYEKTAEAAKSAAKKVETIVEPHVEKAMMELKTKQRKARRMEDNNND